MIIDFRVRPPFKEFANLDLYYDRPVDPTPGHASVFDMQSEDVTSRRRKDMDAFMEEMDDAGIDLGVVVGRHAPNASSDRMEHLLSGHIPNETVLELTQRYEGRFVGVGGVSGSDIDGGLAEIDKCHDWGFPGMAFDNPLSDPPLHHDDESLFPLYERLAERGMFAVITSSIYIGPDISYSDPVHIHRLALRYPELTIVVPHACWPWTSEMCGVAVMCKNVYLVPDVYLTVPSMPGKQDWIDLADVGMFPQMLHASTYPTRGLGQSVRAVKELPFRDDRAIDAILGNNAARLLGLASDE